MSSTAADAAALDRLERFEPRDRPAAIRNEALRLAREARLLPDDERWSYLRALRVAARDGAPLPQPEALPAPAADHRRPSLDRPFLAQSARRFALTGVIAGLAAAVLLPSSLSESVPGTSGNDRAPVRAAPNQQGSAHAGENGARTAAIPTRGVARERAGGRRPASSRKPVTSLAVGAGAMSGTGSRDLGTVRVDGPATLRWSADGRPLVIRSAEWRFRARERSGTTVLTPGTYRRFAVRSAARWKLRLDAAG